MFHQPPSQGSDTGGKKGRSKDERRAAKIAKGKGSNGVVESESNTNGDGGDHDDNEDGPTTPPSAGGMGSSQPIVDEEEDEDDMEWSVDTSEEAARLRAAELGTGVTGLTATNDLEKPIEERLEIFEKYVLARMGEDKFPAKEVVAEADRLDCKDKGVMVLVGTLFKEVRA
jgi:translation initiation factor 5